MIESTFLKACYNKNTSEIPVWFMRQAGRYLPEYRKLRTKYSFEEMVHTPELALEVTLQPIKRFQFDASILYSDILVLPEYFGLHFSFVGGVGPQLDSHYNSLKELSEIMTANQNPFALQFVYQAIDLIKKELNKKNIPLIGFAGSPFTVASYLIERKSSKEFSHVKSAIKHYPETFHNILSMLTEATILYLKTQIKHSVNAIQIFDTWGSILNDHDYLEFSYNYILKIFSELQNENIPLIIYSKDTHRLHSHLCQLPIHVCSVDWNSDLSTLKQQYPNLAFQGNLNPHFLLKDKEAAVKQAKDLCLKMKNESGFIFNLGHGILPKTPLENVSAVLDSIRQA